MQVSGVDGLDAFTGAAGSILPVLAFLGLMSVVSGVVLLAGCANLAGLLSGRVASRQQELSIRVALGARRSRIVRQLLTESLILAFIGGAVGLLLASWLAALANVVAQQMSLPIELNVRPDARIAVYGIVLTAVTAMLFGSAPALRATSADVAPFLKQQAGSLAHKQRLRRMLVAGQVAISSVLLVWSGLFVRSLGQIDRIERGFDPTNVLLADIRFGEGVTSEAARGEQVLTDLQQAVQAAPGVQEVGSASVVPLSFNAREDFSVWPEGAAAAAARRVVASRLTPGWFEAVRIPILAASRLFIERSRGRAVSDRDQ
jgi:hypothetical protein